MENLRILLACGGGFSSGFMATNIKKAAKERNFEWKVNARSDSEISNYVHDVDLIMLGPHLAYLVDEIDEWLKEFPNVKVALMKPEYYSRLDGNLAVDHILSLYEEKKGKE